MVSGVGEVFAWIFAKGILLRALGLTWGQTALVWALTLSGGVVLLLAFGHRTRAAHTQRRP